MTTVTMHTFKLKYGDPSSWSYIELLRSDYVPATPVEGADDLTESGIWRIQGTSKSDLVSKIQAIENVFRRAAEYDQDQIGANQVFVTAQLDGSSDVWESPIYEGRLELPKNALASQWKNLIEYVTLIWRRAPWWEKLKDLPITNDNGSEQTTLQIYNCNDGSGSSPTKKVSNVDIHTADLEGDLPAAVRIDLHVDSTYWIKNVLISQNARTLPLTAAITFEGETGTGDTVDANRSGGKYKTYTIPAGTSGVTKSWSLGNLNSVQTGAWLRILLSAKFSGTIKMTPFVLADGNYYYGPSSIITDAGTNFNLYDLGMIWLPPNNYSLISYGLGAGILFVESAGGTIDIDYAQITPLDSFAEAKMNTYVGWLAAPGQFDRLLIDTHDKKAMGYAWIIADDANEIFTMGDLFGDIFLLPGLDNRLVFKMTNSGIDSMAMNAIVSMKAWVRKKTL